MNRAMRSVAFALVGTCRELCMHRLRMLCFAAAFLNFSTWAATPLDVQRTLIKAATTPAQDYSDEFVR